MLFTQNYQNFSVIVETSLLKLAHFLRHCSTLEGCAILIDFFLLNNYWSYTVYIRH